MDEMSGIIPRKTKVFARNIYTDCFKRVASEKSNCATGMPSLICLLVNRVAQKLLGEKACVTIENLGEWLCACVGVWIKGGDLEANVWR